MQEVDVDTELKVIVVGNGQVGKTSMITLLATGVFTNTYKKTIGTDFMEKDIELESSGEQVKLMLWDTAGQEMFSELTRNYYRGAGAVVYAFSTVDRDSFEAIENWKRKVEEECGPDIVAVLVQNKVDLLEQAVMTPAEVEQLAQKLDVKLYRTCVKDNLHVNDVFQYLAESYVARGGQLAMESTTAVASIADVNQADASTENNNSNNGASNNNSTIKLEPSKRRTGGKKKRFCTIL